MKVIQLHTDEAQLIKKASRQDRGAQKALYKCYAPKMLSVCRMYIKDLHFAEDVLLKAFFKVFKNLKSYGGKGSFEGWIRRIVVHEAIDFLRMKKKWGFMEEFTDENLPVTENIFSERSETDEVQTFIDKLPKGYKTVLILYAVEGYKHEEISNMLGISVGTSKSQLSKARKLMKERWCRREDKEHRI